MSSERVDRIKESPDSCTLSCVGFRMRSMGPFTVESLSFKGQMVNTRDQCVVRLTLAFCWQMRPEFLHYHPCWVKGSTAASPSCPRDPITSNARGIARMITSSRQVERLQSCKQLSLINQCPLFQTWSYLAECGTVTDMYAQKRDIWQGAVCGDKAKFCWLPRPLNATAEQNAEPSATDTRRPFPAHSDQIKIP